MPPASQKGIPSGLPTGPNLVHRLSVMKEVTVYTDGGCSGNPGPGGWAAVLIYGERRKEISGGEPATTNNRMELQAAIEALSSLKEPCRVRLYTDSQYVREGISQWLAGWKQRGWRTQDKKPVKNDALWRRLDELAACHHIEWKWLKGHAGHEHNERCDVLAGAQMAAVRQAHSPAQLKELLTRFRAEQIGAARDDASPRLP